MKQNEVSTSSTAIGKRIRAARESRGWTQMELAIRVGKTPAMISQYELGQDTPGIQNAREFCTVFGWSLDYLYNGETNDG
jgi:transcriptional regulator with XRE-family HTH domain